MSCSAFEHGAGQNRCILQDIFEANFDMRLTFSCLIQAVTSCICNVSGSPKCLPHCPSLLPLFKYLDKARSASSASKQKAASS